MQHKQRCANCILLYVLSGCISMYNREVLECDYHLVHLFFGASLSLVNDIHQSIHSACTS